MEPEIRIDAVVSANFNFVEQAFAPSDLIRSLEGKRPPPHSGRLGQP
jgi:hypothetical protein